MILCPDAQVVVETWLREYNEERPKNGLGGLTPAACGRQLTATMKTAKVTADSKAIPTEGGGTSHAAASTPVGSIDAEGASDVWPVGSKYPSRPEGSNPLMGRVHERVRPAPLLSSEAF